VTAPWLDDLPPGYRLARLGLAVLLGAGVAAGLVLAVLAGTPLALLRLGTMVWLAVRHAVHLP
jgi:hypothetical protein